MRIIARFHKGGALRFISHLDVQRLLQRAMRRAGLPLRYSQGFNPHPLLSFASALSVGHTSDGEWLDVRLEGEVAPGDFAARLNETLPEGLRILEARQIDETAPTLTAMLREARYFVALYPAEELPASAAREQLENFLGGPILVEKRTKGGMKTVDIRPMVLRAEIAQEPLAGIPAAPLQLRVDGALNAAGGLNMELFIKAFLRVCGMGGRYAVHRAAVSFEGMGDVADE